MRSFARALGSRTRLRAIGELSETTELDVSELSRRLNVSQPLMSWHLRRLRRAGLVRARREGRHVRYALDLATLRKRQETLAELIQTFLSQNHSIHSNRNRSTVKETSNVVGG
ncbi:MAG TPA: hypothetical protein DGO43_01530 [Chloroflexi bacterium]|nr:hypothetical protein [Chloroflexota bacterium]